MCNAWEEKSSRDGARAAEAIATSQLGVCGDELCGGRAEAVAFRCLGDCASPPHGQSRVEPFRTPVHAARTLGAGEKPSTGFLGPMAPMQHPSDTNVLVVLDAPREDRARLPGVGQFIVGHLAKPVRRPPDRYKVPGVGTISRSAAMPDQR